MHIGCVFPDPFGQCGGVVFAVVSANLPQQRLQFSVSRHRGNCSHHIPWGKLPQGIVLNNTLGYSHAPWKSSLHTSTALASLSRRPLPPVAELPLGICVRRRLSAKNLETACACVSLSSPLEPLLLKTCARMLTGNICAKPLPPLRRMMIQRSRPWRRIRCANVHRQCSFPPPLCRSKSRGFSHHVAALSGGWGRMNVSSSFLSARKARLFPVGFLCVRLVSMGSSLFFLFGAVITNRYELFVPLRKRL